MIVIAVQYSCNCNYNDYCLFQIIEQLQKIGREKMKEHCGYLSVNKTLRSIKGFSRSFKTKNKLFVRFTDVKPSWNNDCLKNYFYYLVCRYSARHGRRLMKNVDDADMDALDCGGFAAGDRHS